MSHVTAVNMEIKDLDALQAAADELGLELVRDQKTWKWFGTWVNDYHGADAAYKNGINPKDYGKCDHALRVKGNPSAYEIGVYQQPDGSFKLAWDFYGGAGKAVQNCVGRKGEHLKQGYAKAVAVNALKKKGFVPMKIETTEDNKLKITLRG